MQEVIISPFEGCKLVIKGEYTKGEEEINFPSQFEIDSIDLLKGELWDFTEWVTSTNVDYKFILEEMCLQDIELNK